jgi:hypothetical protein
MLQGFPNWRDTGGPESYRYPSHQFTAFGTGAWADELKQDLSGFLKDVDTPGSFFTNNALNAAINPGLDVPGVGPVGLPVSPEVAKSIAATCHASPFGKGSDVDCRK